MDEGDPSQLYQTLLLEQEMNPSQAVAVLVAYYHMSEEEAQLVSREYHQKKQLGGSTTGQAYGGQMYSTS